MEWAELCDSFEKLSQLDQAQRDEFLKNLSKNDPATYQVLCSVFSEDTQFLEEPLYDHFTISLSQKKAQSRRKLSAGEVLGDFEIEEFIGSGATADVYRAFQKSLRRHVAIKVCHQGVDEAQLLARFDHPHVVNIFSMVKIYSQEDQADLSLINLQLVEGWTLQDLFTFAKKSNDFSQVAGRFYLPFSDTSEKGWLSWFLGTLEQVLQGLAYAHSKEVLHLDIKPSNILLRNDQHAFLADFGVSIASVRGESEGIKGGTHKYMSPEQSKALFDQSYSEKVDERSDLYSLAKVTQQFIETFEEFPLPVRERDLLIEIKHLVEICLSSDPNQRFNSAKQFLEEIKRLEWNHLFNEQVGLHTWKNHFYVTKPFISIVTLCILPQLGGSIFNIFYNQSQIIGQLSQSQQNSFMTVTVFYNLIFYPLAVAYFLHKAWPLVSQFWQTKSLPHLSLSLGNKERKKLREILLRLPEHLLIATAIGWLPGSFMFPIAINSLSGTPLSPTDQWHFFFSFFISWLIASCFSYLNLQFLCLGIYYPFTLSGEDQPEKTAITEVVPRLGRQLAFFAAGTLPLIAGIALIHWTEDLNDTLLRFLISYIIVIGIGGMILSSSVSQGLNRLRSFLQN